ncbi:MAG: GTPase [Spirulina sp. SIO3F2]|nr:GTPase [Spirulina sp. SIO3F2]
MTRDELLRVIEEAARTGAKELDLAGQGLTELPPEIGQLTELETLVLGTWTADRKIRTNRLTSLPPEIGLLRNLKSLQIAGHPINPSQGNQLSELPNSIGQLQNLTQLYLNSNQLSELPSSIVQLQNLTQLYLSSNQFSELPNSIVQLQNLTQLYLSYNQFSELPNSIVQLQNLTQLYLNSNQFSELPNSIVQLQNLTELDLRNNQLSELPREIGQLQNLKVLRLGEDIFGRSSNQLSELPSSIFQLQNLTKLDLRNNQLSELPREIGQLQNLTGLYLSYNQLSELPSSIVQLQNLTELDLRNNQLSELPSSIVQLQNFTELDLRNNQLSELPREIGQLQNLTGLYLRNNQLSELPNSIVQLQNLTELDLRNNQLSEMPREIGQLQNLTELDLRNNQLSELPNSIGQLQNLTQLYLSCNQLSELPSSIVQLQNLTELDLRNNQLSELPSSIGQLQNLTQLYLSYNQLSELPSSIVQLQKLRYIFLEGNPLPVIPEVLVNPYQPQAIFDFYFTTQNPNATDDLYEAKFLIIGEGGAGKTSLAKKIQDSNYKLDPDEDPTHGIDVVQWRFEHPCGQDFRVNIWDFGGQEIHHQTHQFFLTERSLYALVVDTRKENTDFPYWLSSIELFGGDSPVLVIENEKGDRPCNVNQQQLKGDFAHIKDFLPTNLKDGRGLAQIKDAIQYHISRLDHVGTPVPKLWAKVRYALENDARNTIEQHEYFELCQRNGVADRVEMLRISDFLHKLGICLHFQDDRVLKHIVILRPEWATNAVYAVTTNKQVAQAKGHFTDADLAKIWRDEQYRNLGDELLQLMEKFKLCYPIPGLQGEYIAPQLLDFSPPYAYDWDSQNNLMLRYEYEFMPKGIVTQLIVRLYRWIEQQQLVWRSGVVLNNGRARAEVLETYRPYKGEIKIRVSGLHSKELLSVITNEIDEINGSFQKIIVTKKVPCLCEECQDDREPHFFKLQILDNYLNKRRYDITCDKSCLDVPVRRLTDAVLAPEFFSYFEGKAENALLDRLKQQHIEYHPDSPQAQTMSNSKYDIKADVVQIIETTEGGNVIAIEKKYTSDPQVKESLNTLIDFLKTLQEDCPDTQPENAAEVLNAEIIHIQTHKPSRWQKLRQQFRNLPKDLRDPERLKQASKSALVQVATDLTDNVFVNAGIAFIDGLSAEPD